MTVRTSEKKDVLIPLYDVQTVIVTSTRMGMTPLLGNGFDFERLTASVIEIG
ncbi:MAG: hypothetical protein IJQ31_03505 [Thermoguttaceae bacterium]|nr:hypothetical protein [Thermoguttaceae bacterium]